MIGVLSIFVIYCAMDIWCMMAVAALFLGIIVRFCSVIGLIILMRFCLTSLNILLCLTLSARTSFILQNRFLCRPYAIRRLGLFNLPNGVFMLLYVYSILDKKAAMFSPPFTARTDVDAARTFDGIKSEPKSNVHRYPDDFDLYCIGQFEDSTGVISAPALPALVRV